MMIQHLLCGALCAAVSGVLVIRAVREYREYHPRLQPSETITAIPQSPRLAHQN